MRIKGRYVANIVMDIDYQETGEYRTFEDVKYDMTSGILTDMIQKLLKDEISLGGAKLTVTQQYADLFQMKEE